MIFMKAQIQPTLRDWNPSPSDNITPSSTGLLKSTRPPAKPSQLIGAADQPAVWQKMWQQPSNPPPNRRMKDLAIDRHNEGSDLAL